MRDDFPGGLTLGLSLASVALLDLLTPLGFAIPVLYAVAPALAWRGPPSRVLLAALAGSALTVAGYFGSSFTVTNTAFAWGNRGLALAAIWVVAIVIRAFQKTDWKKYDLAVKLDRVMEAAPDYSILQLDLEGRIAWWSRAARNLYGYEAEEALGKPLARLFPDDEQPDADKALQKASSSGRIEWEGRRRKKSGQLFPARMLLAELRDAHGSAAGYCEITQDLTAHREIEMRERTARRMQAMGVVAAGVSHDLNNVFSVILGRSSLLSKQAQAADPLIADVEEIKIAAQRGAEMTGKLLAFGRRQPLSPRPFDLNALIAEMQSLLRMQIPDNVERRFNLEPDLPPAFADPVQIQQVLINLVGNACDAMPAGGSLTIKTARIDLEGPKQNAFSTIPPGRYIALSVEDAGSGVDESSLARVVEPFFTTKQESGGSGLGLAAVFGILTQGGGGLDLANRSDGGAVATAYLPPAASENVGSSTAESLETGEPRAGAGSVLLVEGDQSLRRLIKKALAHEGFEVQAVEPSSASEALEDPEAEIDLLLTDLVLPQGSGLELARAAAHRKPAVKTLLIAGYAESLESPAESWSVLPKPFTVKQLLDAVTEQIGGPPRDEEPS